MKKFLSVIAIALSLVACKKDNTILHGLTSMGDLVGNSLYTDEGLVLTITKASCKEGYDVNERLYFYCDLLKELAPNKYEIELKDWVRVLRKNAILSSAIEDDEALGHEPIHLGSAWYAGGYLNMNVGIMYKKDSETKHILNLVLLQDQSDDNNLVFQLRHNGNGESGTSPDHISGSTYFSVPISSIIPKGKDQINVKILWSWYQYSEKTGDYEIVEKSTEGTI